MSHHGNVFDAPADNSLLYCVAFTWRLTLLFTLIALSEVPRMCARFTLSLSFPRRVIFSFTFHLRPYALFTKLSLAVFKFRLKTHLFHQTVFWPSSPPPLKLRPYGDIEMCVLVLTLLLSCWSVRAYGRREAVEVGGVTRAWRQLQQQTN